jgi:hypothetical protein|tara:strand:- start:150 stop:527 length:378 start_codon:yes stop_codon:yes gene_type:complete
MSFNRTKYDTCNYKQDLQENVSTLSYIMTPFRYENENKCRHQLGFIGGTNVSHIKGNIVDLESELRGQTRVISKCGTNYYIPTDDNIVKNDKTEPIDTTLKHLGSCQSIMYRSIPLPPKMNFNKC